MPGRQQVQPGQQQEQEQQPVQVLPQVLKVLQGRRSRLRSQTCVSHERNLWQQMNGQCRQSGLCLPEEQEQEQVQVQVQVPVQLRVEKRLIWVAQ